MNHAAIEAEFAAALADPARPVPGWARSPRGDVDARRFAVYRNNVHVGLVGALRSKFPVTARLVGEDFFSAMARVFVGIEKPTSPLLAEYGAGFPDFIAGFEPARSVRYLPDMARLEIAWTEAYHAADAAALGVAALAARPQDDLLAIAFRPHPAARLVSSRYPVGSIWSANQAETVAPVSGKGPESVLVTRPDAEVTLRVIAEADAAFCGALLAGETIETAAAAAFETDPAFNLPEALVGLVGVGAFAAVIQKGQSE